MISVVVQAMESSAVGLQMTEVRAGTGQTIPPESLALVDWEQAYLDLLAYKERKGLKNFVICPEAPRMVIENMNYTLMADEAVVKPRSFAERALLQDDMVK